MPFGIQYEFDCSSNCSMFVLGSVRIVRFSRERDRFDIDMVVQYEFFIDAGVSTTRINKSLDGNLF